MMTEKSYRDLPGYDFLTEQMTESDLSNFIDSIDSWMACNYCDSDYYTAQISPWLWRPVRFFMEQVDKYYS